MLILVAYIAKGAGDLVPELMDMEAPKPCDGRHESALQWKNGDPPLQSPTLLLDPQREAEYRVTIQRAAEYRRSE